MSETGPRLPRRANKRECAVCKQRKRFLGGHKCRWPHGSETFVCGECWHGLWRRLWKALAVGDLDLRLREVTGFNLPSPAEGAESNGVRGSCGPQHRRSQSHAVSRRNARS